MNTRYCYINSTLIYSTLQNSTAFKFPRRAIAIASVIRMQLKFIYILTNKGYNFKNLHFIYSIQAMLSGTSALLAAYK
jgi:hypothetical protein